MGSVDSCRRGGGGYARISHGRLAFHIGQMASVGRRGSPQELALLGAHLFLGPGTTLARSSLRVREARRAEVDLHGQAAGTQAGTGDSTGAADAAGAAAWTRST